MKKSKNIFNYHISPENLMEEEGTRQFKVGNRSINSNWLVGVQRSQYQKYILSTLYFSELEKQLYELKEHDHNQTRQSNLFKIGNIKKKINNFALVQENKEKPLGEPSLVKNQIPDMASLIVQKKGGFFSSLLQRKCKLQQKEIWIESKKDSSQPWMKIGISKYSIQLQSKEKPLSKEQFTQYQWLLDFQYRLLLSGQQLKPYTIYGHIEELKSLQRYFQVQNIEVKQLGVFAKLDNQFQQKIITLFGNKVRFFDHNLKIRRAQLQQQQNQINRTNESMDEFKRQETARFKNSKISSELGQSENNKSVDFLINGNLQKSATDPLDQTTNKQNEFISSIVNLQTKIQGHDNHSKLAFFNKNKQKKDTMSIFKLKINKSTVFYDEIEQAFNFDDNQKVQINDLQLNLRDQIGISQVDQQSSHRNPSNYVPSKKKVVHMSLKNSMDEAERFNINIHEVSSNMSTDRKNSSRYMRKDSVRTDQWQIDDERSSNKSLKSLNLSHIDSPSHDKEYKQFHRNNTVDMIEIFSGIQSDQDQKDEIQMPKFNKEKFLIKNQTARKKGQVQIYQNLKNSTIFYALEEIQMFIPYNKETLSFEILQIDLNLQLQNKLTVISRASGLLYHQVQKEKERQKQKYTIYSIEGGLHFKFSQQSDQFVFVLKEESKHYYISFSIDPRPKYQRNCSQLLIKQIDQEGFPFACSLSLFSSPHTINLNSPLSTIEFMQKYLNNGQDYNFKQDFIDDKRRRFLVKRQWNKILLSSILKQGNSDNFSRAIFLGLSESLFKKMKKNVQYNPKRLFDYNENEYRMMQQNIFSIGVMDLRSFMKPFLLIKHITQALYNQYFRQRLQHLYVYFLNRYGSIRNYALIFIKEVISKIQPIIIYGRKEKQVFDIIDLYFQVQYEIDELFLEIGKYFNK